VFFFTSSIRMALEYFMLSFLAVNCRQRDLICTILKERYYTGAINLYSTIFREDGGICDKEHKQGVSKKRS